MSSNRNFAETRRVDLSPHQEKATNNQGRRYRRMNLLKQVLLIGAAAFSSPALAQTTATTDEPTGPTSQTQTSPTGHTPPHPATPPTHKPPTPPAHPPQKP